MDQLDELRKKIEELEIKNSRLTEISNQSKRLAKLGYKYMFTCLDTH